MNSSDDSISAEEERRAIVEERAFPWMIAAYVLTGVGCAILLFGPHVPLNEFSPLRLGAVIASLVGTACLLTFVGFRYPESTRGNEFRVAMAIACGIAVTGPVLWYAGLFDENLYVRGTRTLANWLTSWEGGWGQNFVAGLLSFLPALPATKFFGYLFNADESFQSGNPSRREHRRSSTFSSSSSSRISSNTDDLSPRALARTISFSTRLAPSRRSCPIEYLW
jgi:hypothetical protein